MKIKQEFPAENVNLSYMLRDFFKKYDFHVNNVNSTGSRFVVKKNEKTYRMKIKVSLSKSGDYTLATFEPKVNPVIGMLLAGGSLLPCSLTCGSCGEVALLAGCAGSCTCITIPVSVGVLSGVSAYKRYLEEVVINIISSCNSMIKGANQFKKEQLLIISNLMMREGLETTTHEDSVHGILRGKTCRSHLTFTIEGRKGNLFLTHRKKVSYTGIIGFLLGLSFTPCFCFCSCVTAPTTLGLSMSSKKRMSRKLDKMTKNITSQFERLRKEGKSISSYIPTEPPVRYQVREPLYEEKNERIQSSFSGRSHHMVPFSLSPVSPAIEKSIPGYRITHKIGSGGFATVYRATDTYGRAVALKLPKFLDETIDYSLLDKFKSEAEIWKKLKHKNIVQFYSSDTIPMVYLSIELMEGGNLKQLTTQHRLSVREAVGIMLQVLDGMSYAHRMATVHRDIKPENILFTKDGIAKISDWGIGKFMASEGATKSMGTKGTLLYCAPEQISKKKFGDVDWSTDVFQLGIVFYEMLTGVNPFCDEDSAGIVGKVLYENVVSSSTVNHEVPQVLDNIVMKAIQKQKQNRWRSADVMYDRLKEIVGFYKDEEHHTSPRARKPIQKTIRLQEVPRPPWRKRTI